MTYPIHDWRDENNYSTDPLKDATKEFLENQKALGKSVKEMREALCHWSFLRRHKLYQDNWENDDAKYTSAFGVGDVPRPNPKDDFPPNLLFSYEVFNRPGTFLVSFDLSQPKEKIMERMKLFSTIFEVSRSTFDKVMAACYVPRPNVPKTRKQKDLCKIYLRVLDAFADGATHVQVARVLGSTGSEDSFIRNVTRWKKGALDTQASLTKLPRMTKQDIIGG